MIGSSPFAVPEPRCSPAAHRSVSVRCDEPTTMALLSGVAGYVDAAGFIALMGLFPAHVTGELVGAAVAIGAGYPHQGVRWAMIVVFIVSVIAAALVSRGFRQRGVRGRAPLLGLMTLALLLFTASGFLSATLASRMGTSALVLRGGSAVAAMAFQNALMRERFNASCPTTVMTGNLTQFIIELVELCCSRATRKRVHDPAERAAADHRLKQVGTTLAAFIAGAALGGGLTRAWGLASVMLPLAVTAILTAFAWRESHTELRPRA